MDDATKRPDAQVRRAAWAVALISLLLHLPGFFEPLWIDDTLRTFSTFVAPERWWTWVLRDVHNPLYNVFMRGWIHVAGDSPLAIRLPTVVCAHLAALVLGLWAGRRFGAWTGVLAAAFFLFNPAQILHATMAKNGLVTVCFGVMWVVLADRLREGARKTMPAACAVGVLGVYTDWAFMYAVGAASCMVIAEGAIHRRWAVLRRLGVVLGVVAAAALPLVLYKIEHIDHLYREYPRHFTLTELWRLLGNWMLWGNAMLPAPAHRVLIASIGMGLVVPLLAAAGWRFARTASGRLALGALWLPIVVTLAISAVLVMRGDASQTMIFQERNLLIVLPWFALGLARGVTALKPAWLSLAAGGVVLSVLVTAAVLQWTIYRREATSYWPRPDFRAMVRAVVEDIESDPGTSGHAAGDPSRPIRAAVVCLPPRATLRYYLRGVEGIDVIPAQKWKLYPYDFPRFADERGIGRVYLVQSTAHVDWMGNPDHRERMDRRWEVRLVRKAGVMELWRMDRRPRPLP
ncbi:MAG: glycosyltransferase family 39 protein [Phycisphaeraceae bacterium]|nr:glycosyltransferase family 39 protein [Phycisphaeraceae bacterium]MCW5754897.1 glycosyltransferase family 39 protein [Phycisphaeraceae bacterium]